MAGTYENAQGAGIPFGRYMAASRNELFIHTVEVPTGAPGPWPRYHVISRRRYDGVRWQEVEQIPLPWGAGGLPIYAARLAASHDTLIFADEVRTPGGIVAVYDLAPGRASHRVDLVSDMYQANGKFGNDIDVSGDRLVIGEPFTSRGGQGSVPTGNIVLWQGAVHIFERTSSGGWGNRIVLTPLDISCPTSWDAFGAFGSSVAVDGDVIVVGCVGVHDNASPFPPPAHVGFGCALVFERVAGTWQNTACLRVPPNAFSGGGCWGVAVRGDRIIASDLRWNAPAPFGRVYVFERDVPGPGNWVFKDELRASDGALSPLGYATDTFGRTLDLSDDEILVGAPNATPDRNPAFYGRGAAYRFHKVNGQWQEERIWTTRTTLPASQGSDQLVGEFVGFVDGGIVVSAGGGIGATPGIPSGVVCFYPDPIATTVCDGAANSVSAEGARLEVRGSPVAGLGPIGFHGSDFPAHAYGFLAASGRPGATPNPVGAGTLCLGAPVVRIPGSTRQASPGGVWIAGFDLAAPPLASALPILSGQRWRFQAWYRDMHPAPTSNLSEAVEIEFR